MDDAMNDRSVPPAIRWHVPSMGAHGIFHGRGSVCVHHDGINCGVTSMVSTWCTMDDAIMVEPNTMACFMAPTTDPWTVPWNSP